MSPRKNSGFGNFRGSKSQNSFGFNSDFSVRKITKSSGTYPSKMEVGDTRIPTVIEAWNRDSRWKRWWEGFELARRSKWGWPLKKIHFNYQFDLNGTIEEIKSKCHIYPSLTGDSKCWYTLVRDDSSLDLTTIIETPPTGFVRLGDFNDLDDNTPTTLWRAEFNVRPGKSSEAIGLVSLFSRVKSRRVLNRWSVDLSDPANPKVGSPQEYFYSIKVWALMPDSWVNTTKLSMYFSGGVLIQDPVDNDESNGTPLGEFDPTNPQHIAWVSTPPRAVTLGRTFSCSCPDFTKRVWFDMENPGEKTDSFRAPAPTTETNSELEERVGYFRSWANGPELTDDPKHFCKHIYSLAIQEGYYIAEPNDMPVELNREEFVRVREKKRNKLADKMLEAMTKYKAISADNASFPLSKMFSLEKKNDTLIPDQPWNPMDPSSGYRPSWYQTVEAPSIPQEGDIWQVPGGMHVKKYIGGIWTDISLINGN